MTYATTCLLRAFQPWLRRLLTVDVNSSLDLNPFDGDGLSASLSIDVEAELAHPQRLIAKSSAWKYGFRLDEDTTFNLTWALAESARELYRLQHHTGGLLDTEIRAAFSRIFFDAQLEHHFANGNVCLVLGHSHEPRHDAWNPAQRRKATRYLNSGAAGRFENLIWCVEIIDGAAQVAAWHRPEGPGSGRTPERRVYSPIRNETANESWLVASHGNVELPAPVSDASAEWLVPSLHMMS